MAEREHGATTWVDDARERLAAAGYRRGGARAAILDQLDRQPCALTAYEIESELATGARAVGRASVYRILEELHELGLVTKIELGEGRARYEPARSGHHHHHLVCDRCGVVEPFADAALERAIDRVSGQVDFDVTGHEISLHGICAACR
jgi:Fur family ferric uptake transcriptional regulator